MTDGVIAYLGLGSNVGDQDAKQTRLKAAVLALRELRGTAVTQTSSLYESEPWGYSEQAPFLNAVVEIRTCLSPQELLESVKAVEQKLGRTPTFRWGPREIDIDVLLYGDVSMNEPYLALPHKHIAQREFVLRPLLEINPGATLPDGTRLAKALAEIGPATVKRLETSW